jgi:hypothetical protein
MMMTKDPKPAGLGSAVMPRNSFVLSSGFCFYIFVTLDEKRLNTVKIYEKEIMWTNHTLQLYARPHYQHSIMKCS